MSEKPITVSRGAPTSHPLAGKDKNPTWEVIKFGSTWPDELWGALLLTGQVGKQGPFQTPAVRLVWYGWLVPNGESQEEGAQPVLNSDP